MDIFFQKKNEIFITSLDVLWVTIDVANSKRPLLITAKVQLHLCILPAEVGIKFNTKVFCG